MKSNYTLEDIRKFVEDYKETQGFAPNDIMLSVPFVGKKAYEKSLLEQKKRNFFEQAYEKAKSGSIEEQEEFIKKMTPILNDFYSKKGTIKRKI